MIIFRNFFFWNFELNEELVTRNGDDRDIRGTHGNISADPEVFQDPYKFVVLPATFLISRSQTSIDQTKTALDNELLVSTRGNHGITHLCATSSKSPVPSSLLTSILKRYSALATDPSSFSPDDTMLSCLIKVYTLSKLYNEWPL